MGNDLLRLTVLGSAPPYPAADNPCSGYLVSCGGGQVWVDAGSGTLGPLQRHARLDELDAIWISHLHADHCADLLTAHYGALYADVRLAAPIPLEEAVRRGRAAEVARLVAAGADPEQPIGEYRETTPLCLAAASGHTAVVRVLLAAGVHPDARNGLGHLPLVLAATAGRAGHPAAVDLLLDAGADIEARTRGRTALEWADGFGLTETARRLRGRGARPAGAGSPQPE
ncbi:ankyrin repeat domain-containing protein [Kitasatospora sp. NPDC007106]|uniref:ankyrin repeat domain-containing protein n=1 Tax=Kitasatospora sp. NPDC007106 TaxID=3156914 RepID=UPI003402E5F3